MSTVLVVDGSDVCRAPIVEYALRKQFAGEGPLGTTEVVSRGLDTVPGRPICDIAASRIGVNVRAASFSADHRSASLGAADALGADLILTAERLQRSAVGRVAPAARDNTFTLKEALVLTTVLADEVRQGRSPRPATLAELVALLHDVRGSIPLIEPAMKTSTFHRDRALPAADPLNMVDGHEDAGLHRHATDEAYQVALTLGSRMVDVTEPRLATIGAPRRDVWWRQQA